jgi:hypothetical protein
MASSSSKKRTQGACRRRLEDVVQPALTLAKPEVEHVLETDDQEAGTQLARHGASKEGLAAARRPVE